jgi:hypothetical protein
VLGDEVNHGGPDGPQLFDIEPVKCHWVMGLQGRPPAAHHAPDGVGVVEFVDADSGLSDQFPNMEVQGD